MSQNYFITIGIGQYANGPASLGASCSNDCAEMAKVLINYGFLPLRYQYFTDPANPKPDLEERDAILLDGDATLKNITNLFEKLRLHPAFKKQSPDPPNNLIIYYSGHGLSGELWEEKEYYYWVPCDYNKKLSEEADDTILYSWEHDLLPNLGKIRFQHLIFINDSCYSGRGLSIDGLVPQRIENKGIHRKDYKSVWAICSCAANELAYTNATNSLFTTKLVERLNNQELDEFNLSTLVEEMNNLNLRDQSVFGARLHIIPDNRGNYLFELSKEAKAEKAKKALVTALKDGLPMFLNYNRERRMLKTLPEKSDAVLIFSNNKDSGLPLLIRSAKTDTRFKAHGKPLKIVPEKDINHETDMLQKCFSFFNLAMGLKGPVKSRPELVRKISLRLETSDYFVGLLLHEESKKNSNLGFVTELTDIVNETHNLRKFNKHLCLFVLDEFVTDYSQLNLASGQNIFSKLITDKISIVSTDIDDWYDLHTQFIDKEKNCRADFIKDFLKDGIYIKICNTFQEETPAFVIRKICETANFPELAEMLLTKIDD